MTASKSPLILLLSLILLSSGSYLAAQNATGQIPMIEVEVCDLGLRRFPPLYYRSADGEFLPLKVAKSSRGQRSTLPATEVLQLYHKVANPAPEEPPFKPVFRIPLLPSTEHQLILIYNNEKGRFQFRVLPADAQSHPAGTVQLVNLFNTEIALKLGNDRLILKPGEGRQFVPDADDRFQFAFAFEYSKGHFYKSPEKRLVLKGDRERLLIAITSRINGTGSQATLFPHSARLYDLAPVEETNRYR